jgi:hypothetical protein
MALNQFGRMHTYAANREAPAAPAPANP